MKPRMEGLINPDALERLDRMYRAHSVSEALFRRSIPLETDVYNLDACDFLARLPAKSVDLIVNDEDYSAGENSWNPAAADSSVSKFDWRVGKWPSHLEMPWVALAADSLKESAALVCFGFPQWSTTFQAVAEHVGLTLRSHRVWIKTNSAPHRRKQAPNFSSHHEYMWICSKGKFKPNVLEPRVMCNWVMGTTCLHCKAMYPRYLSSEWDHPEWFKSVDCWEKADFVPKFNGQPIMNSLCPACNRTHGVYYPEQADIESLKPFYVSPFTNDPGRVHKAKKPDWLLAELVTILSAPGHIVVDPMCGQGTTGVQATRLGRIAVLNDLDLKWSSFSSRAIALHQNLAFAGFV